MLKGKFLNLTNDGWLKNILTLSSGAVLAQFIVIAMMPILSRIYSPDIFADLALLMAIYSIIGVTASLKYDAAIMLPKSNRQSDYIFSICIYLALIVFAALALVEIFFLFYDFEFLQGTHYFLIFLGILTGLSFSIYISCNVRLNRNKNYYALARLPVIQNIIISALALLFGMLGFKNGLVNAQVIGVGFISLCAVYISRNGIRKISNAKLQALLKRHINLPKYIFPASLIDTLSQQLPFFMTIYFFDSMVGGQFSMAWRIMMIPMALIGASISQVFFQRFSDLSGNLNSQINEIFRTWKFLIVLGILPLILLLFLAEDLFVFVLGDQWTEAGKIAFFLAPMFFMRFVSSPTSSAFVVLGLQRYTFIFSLALLLVRPIVLIVGFRYDLYVGIILLSIVEIIQVSLYNGILIRYLQGLIAIKYKENS